MRELASPSLRFSRARALCSWLLRLCLACLCWLSPATARAERVAELWPGASFGWDVRLEAVSLFKRYTLEQEQAWFSGHGAGGGATASVHFRPPIALMGGVARWVELELGVGNSTHVLAWQEGRAPRSRSDVIHTQTSAIAGIHFASGRWHDDGDGAPWSGAVIGIAWLPTYVHFFGSDDFAADGKVHPAGLRLTVDWGRITPITKGRVPGLRAVLTWLPYVNSLPTAVSAGVGCVFY